MERIGLRQAVPKGARHAALLAQCTDREKITESYETFSVEGFRLARIPEQPPDLYLAALRPGMLRLAGKEADGAILNWLGPHDVPKAVSEFHEVGGEGKAVVARIFVDPP